MALLEKIKWVGGPWCNRPDWTKEQLNWAINRDTLRAQAGMNLDVKAKKFQRKWKVGCRPWELRAHYKGCGIRHRAFKITVCGKKH